MVYPDIKAMGVWHSYAHLAEQFSPYQYESYAEIYATISAIGTPRRYYCYGNGDQHHKPRRFSLLHTSQLTHQDRRNYPYHAFLVIELVSQPLIGFAVRAVLNFCSSCLTSRIR